MIKIEKQFNLNGKTILFFNSDLPKMAYTKILIDGKEYIPGVVYGAKDSLGIAATGDFEGKEVKFIA